MLGRPDARTSERPDVQTRGRSDTYLPLFSIFAFVTAGGAGAGRSPETASPRPGRGAGAPAATNAKIAKNERKRHKCVDR